MSCIFNFDSLSPQIRDDTVVFQTSPHFSFKSFRSMILQKPEIRLDPIWEEKNRQKIWNLSLRSFEKVLTSSNDNRRKSLWSGNWKSQEKPKERERGKSERLRLWVSFSQGSKREIRRGKGKKGVAPTNESRRQQRRRGELDNSDSHSPIQNLTSCEKKEGRR